MSNPPLPHARVGDIINRWEINSTDKPTTIAFGLGLNTCSGVEIDAGFSSTVGDGFTGSLFGIGDGFSDEGIGIIPTVAMQVAAWHSPLDANFVFLTMGDDDTIPRWLYELPHTVGVMQEIQHSAAKRKTVEAVLLTEMERRQRFLSQGTNTFLPELYIGITGICADEKYSDIIKLIRAISDLDPRLHMRIIIDDPQGGAYPFCWNKGTDAIVYYGEERAGEAFLTYIRHGGELFLSEDFYLYDAYDSEAQEMVSVISDAAQILSEELPPFLSVEL